MATVLGTAQAISQYFGVPVPNTTVRTTLGQLKVASIRAQEVWRIVQLMGGQGTLTSDVVALYDQLRINLFSTELKAYAEITTALRTVGLESEAASIPVPLLLPAWTGAVLQTAVPDTVMFFESQQQGLAGLRGRRMGVGRLGVVGLLATWGGLVLLVGAAAWILDRWLSSDVRIAATIAESFSTATVGVVQARLEALQRCSIITDAPRRAECVNAIVALAPMPATPALWSWKPKSEGAGWWLLALGVLLPIGAYATYRVVKWKYLS